ncbi:UNVERIFIED_CONTAM: hypothetical protein PYX00_004564 [Menopon gallinae]|uniref:Complex I assembly factor TIMMDC1, mitochondrial n=1 Tax=Menopon gallinae TaxID=328185 RepID=A0AAW2I573_9NEOP
MLRTIKLGNGFLIANAVLQQSDKNPSAENRKQIPAEPEPDKPVVHTQPKMVSSTYQEMRKKYEESITGWDRIKMLFRVSKHQELDPDWGFISKVSMVGCLCGFFHRGMKDFEAAVALFIHTNDASKFASMAHARRELLKQGVKAFTKGGTIAGAKGFILSGTFITTSTLVSTYRGKSGILEWMAAGSATSALMRWNLGIKGMISGCVSGGITGTIVGIVIYLGLKLTGNTISDIKYFMLMEDVMAEKEQIRRRQENLYENLEKVHKNFTEHLPPGFPDDENLAI